MFTINNNFIKEVFTNKKYIFKFNDRGTLSKSITPLKLGHNLLSINGHQYYSYLLLLISDKISIAYESYNDNELSVNNLYDIIDENNDPVVLIYGLPNISNREISEFEYDSVEYENIQNYEKYINNIDIKSDSQYYIMSNCDGPIVYVKLYKINNINIYIIACNGIVNYF